MTRAWKILFLAAALAAPVAAELLDQQKIHSLYSDGEFEKVVQEIDGFTHRNKTYSHADSAFIARYLAVVYAANPATREKAKYYMYQLLKLQPEAQLMGMYANEEIEKLFERMKTEYYSQNTLQGMPAPARPANAAPASEAPVAAAPVTAAAPPDTAKPARETRAERAARKKRERAAADSTGFRRVGFLVFGSLDAPMGIYAGDNLERGAAAVGIGLGGEFLLRFTKSLGWATQIGCFINPLSASSDSLGYDLTGGGYVNIPILTGIRYGLQPSRLLGLYGIAQAGFNEQNRTDLVYSSAGTDVFTVTFGSDNTFAFSLGAGLTFGRHFNASLRYFNLGKPSHAFKGTNESDGTTTEGKTSVPTSVAALLAGFQF